MVYCKQKSPATLIVWLRLLYEKSQNKRIYVWRIIGVYINLPSSGSGFVSKYPENVYTYRLMQPGFSARVQPEPWFNPT